MAEENIHTLREYFVGRRVLDVRERVYPSEDGMPPAPAGFPVFILDDGSEIVMLDGWGNPPLHEREVEPWSGE